MPLKNSGMNSSKSTSYQVQTSETMTPWKVHENIRLYLKMVRDVGFSPHDFKNKLAIK